MDDNSRNETVEQLGSQVATLEQLLEVHEQTVIDQSIELEQLLAELERSNDELEQFASVASHDLQEPLRVITSYLQLLDRRYKDRLDADARRFIARTVDGAARMKRLIAELLTYSRVGTRGNAFEPTKCSEALSQGIDNLQVAIEESGALVTHGVLPTVLADDVQLVQLFQNLIGNAIKFCGNHQPKIHVGASREDTEWVFFVQDNGIGIDREHSERIFLIFQRLHTQKEYEGTGVGLATCRKIIERHGGRIWVESVPQVGSTFYFTIPDKGVTAS